jgi:hypothetical protein
MRGSTNSEQGERRRRAGRNRKADFERGEYETADRIHDGCGGKKEMQV